MTRSPKLLQQFVILAITLYVAQSITVEDVYKRLLERERNIDNTFTSQFIRPIGSVGGELIWPRSYSKPSYLFFDENGAAYNVRPGRPSLQEILRRTPFSSLNNNVEPL
ncbi:hypothetical protein L596_003807 [Steinernema carpocapsae]|uniref:Uncharacterized protein n=1 Tax=Steinernema carpocapsae TaxID=34508 RepID=A0A4U8UVE6_STECR|nr:hypothetical protein L596_003807 [Steinernema carpocapsae]